MTAPVDKKNCLKDRFPNVYRILIQVVNNLFQETRNKQLKTKPLLLKKKEGDDLKEVDSYTRLVLTSYLVTCTSTYRLSKSVPR